MGFADGKIILDHENGTYYVGEAVQGRVVFDLGKVNKFRGIYVSITGFCKVHWTTNHTKNNEDKEETYTKTHESYEEYLNQKVYLLGGSQGEYSLNPGHYELPFTCVLDKKLPSSFEGSHGHIRYGVKAIMDLPFSTDPHLFMPLNIIAPFDLKKYRHAKEPIAMEIYKSYCCWCMNYGAVEILVKVPASGFAVGQNIPIEVACTNSSRVDIKCIRFTVNRKTEYIATTEAATKEDDNKVAEIGKGPAPAHSARNWTLDLEVPYITAYNLAKCRFINIQYEFKVSVEVGGCHQNTSESQRIYFGCTPIFGDNQGTDLTQTLNRNQAPSPITNANNTPVYQPFPTTIVSPYPANPAPYPVVSAYPVQYPVNPAFPSSPAYPATTPMAYPQQNM